ncbi:hypothetical protein [Nocardia sp. NPDC127526]|uniref:hypothetical protein n=1 Tax=Nocardia sp. NPDC127526 TaxID=3345393 RepID=UPI0036261503
MNFRSGSRRRPSSQRRRALFGGAVVAIIGLVVGLVAACTLADRVGISAGAVGPDVVAAVADNAPAVAVPGSAEHVAFIGQAPACRKTPEQPAAPVQAAAPHREDIRLPLAIPDAPVSVIGECRESGAFVPIDASGPPVSPLDLTTVLRI